MNKFPDGNPKTQYGVAKPNLTNVPPVGMFRVGQVMACGAEKYGPMNWRDDKITASVYVNAALRHLLTYWDGQDLDEETHLPHLAHAAACLLILLDAEAQGMLQDDRPTVGMLNAFIRQHTKGIANGNA
jgi:hypothetical protein